MLIFLTYSVSGVAWGLFVGILTDTLSGRDMSWLP
jgi:hypothetical protein